VRIPHQDAERHRQRSPRYRARKRLGITREAVWIQHSPDGDAAVVHLEAHDLSRALTGMGTSEDPFDRWLRQLGVEIHGVDRKAGFPPVEQILDFHSQRDPQAQVGESAKSP
jgi:hypothetical protein